MDTQSKRILDVSSSVVIPPNVKGTSRFVLSMKVTEFSVDERSESTNWMIQVRFWGSELFYPIRINQNHESIGLNESTLFSVCCSLDQLSNYWKDAEAVYLEVVDFDTLQRIGFGFIDTREFGSFKENEYIDEIISIYSLETGFRIGVMKCVMIILPFKSDDNF